MVALSKVTLRQAKMAKTKLDLLRSMLDLLQHKSFDDMTVRDICAPAMVSEGTFFNYFQKKSDLLAFFIEVWTLEAAIEVRDKVGKDAGLDGVEMVLEFTAAKMRQNARIMNEIIATIAKTQDKWEVQDLTQAEREEAFPGVEGLMDLPARGLKSLIPPLIQRAVEKGELPKGTSVMAVTGAVISVFFGVPLLKTMGAEVEMAEEYRRQLRLLWAGTRAGGLASLGV